MANKIRILGIPGSLRKDSFNRAVLKAAVQLVPEGAEMEIFELGGIPVFNQDLEKEMPQPVKEFKRKIAEADAIVFSTPEYNYSIPGVLKNAIDWASRPYGDNSWNGKPAAIMTASNGTVGGSRAQYHLRQVMVYTNMHPLNKPEVIIPMVAEKVSDGVLQDQHTKEKIREMLQALVEWTILLKGGK